MNRILLAIVYMAIAVAAYAASAPIVASVLTMAGTSCTSGLVTTACAFGRQTSFDPAVYGALATAATGALLWARLSAHDRPWYPLVATFSLIALGAMAYDATFARPVIGGEKLSNDTFDMLRMTVLASFLLVFGLGRHIRYDLFRAVSAIAVSLAGLVIAELAFQAFSGHLVGATQMFMIFMLYAFVGFGIHLMAVSNMFASGTIEPKEPAAA
jgi:hypothetical protein